MSEILVSSREIAQKFPIYTLATWRSYASKGIIPSVKINGKVFFNIEAIDQFLRDKTEERSIENEIRK